MPTKRKILEHWNESKRAVFGEDGEPKHPLYLRKDLEPVPYEIGATS